MKHAAMVLMAGLLGTPVLAGPPRGVNAWEHRCAVNQMTNEPRCALLFTTAAPKGGGVHGLMVELYLDRPASVATMSERDAQRAGLRIDRGSSVFTSECIGEVCYFADGPRLLNRLIGGQMAHVRINAPMLSAYFEVPLVGLRPAHEAALRELEELARDTRE